jgi:hypothetical protein
VTLLLLGAQRELVLSVHTHLGGVAHRLLSADGGFAERDSFCDAKKMVQSSLVSSLAYINEKGGATAVAEKREAYYRD